MKTSIKILLLLALAFMCISCGTRAHCDAYSHSNNDKDTLSIATR